MHKRHLLQIAVSVFTIILMGFSAWAVPGTINYQGRLTDPDGVSLDGYYIMEFYLYNAVSGGSHLWTEQQNVAVTNGVYNVELGEITSFPLELFDNENLYLEVKIFSTSTGWETLSPRQCLTSTAFSIKAGHSDTANDANTVDGYHVNEIGIPSGMIAMFNCDCPSGWTRLGELDGRFPRGASSYGDIGGNQDHSHVFNHTHSVSASGGTNSAGSHWHDMCGGCGTLPGKEDYWGPLNNSSQHNAGEHTHTVTVSGGASNPNPSSTNNSSSIPPYLNVIFCVKD